MSVDTDRTWFYELKGRKIHLWKYVRSASVDTLGDYKIRTPEDYSGPSLIYPDEAITNGLRFEYSALAKVFTKEDPSETVESSLTEEATPSEMSHVNLNRMLSLAIVDFVKAALAERQGNIQLKEYYMREFHSKIADNESNKNKVYIVHPIDTFAVK